MNTYKRFSIVMTVVLAGTFLLSAPKLQAAEPAQDFFNRLRTSLNNNVNVTTSPKEQTMLEGPLPLHVNDQNLKPPSTNLLSLTSQELVTNGNFEASPVGTGWNDPNGDIGTWGYAYSGTKSAFIGYTLSSVDLIYQNISIPINTKSATASFNWRMYRFENLPGYDSIKFRVIKTSDFNVVYCDRIYDPVNYAQGTWWTTNCDVTAARGEDVTVVIGVSNDSSLSTWIYADDVSVLAQLDTTAPISSASINPVSPDGLDGWYKNTPLVSLDANDEVGGMGLMDSVYWIDDPNAYQIYSTPFSIPDGVHTVYYLSIDNGWNFENEKSFTIKVDTTKPIITLNGNSIFRVAQNTVYSEPGAIATDVLDPAVTAIASGTVTTTILGDYTISYNATDHAGNVADPIARTVRVVEPSDISALTTAITNAQTILAAADEGDVPGQKPIGSKAILQNVIAAAQGITTAYLQSDVDVMIVTLNDAVTTFNSSVVPPSNLTALSSAIASAQTIYTNSVEGTSPGQYPAPLKANLLAAINVAQTITSAQAQSVVDSAVSTLNGAVATFSSGVVPPSNLSALAAAIASAQATYDGAIEGTSPGQYPAPLKGNLLAAINSARAVSSAYPQSTVDASIAPLNSAVTTFLAGVVPPPPPAPPAPPVPVVVVPVPVPQVLGATAFHPVIKNLTLVKRAYSYKLNGKTIKITPFGTDYKGAIWAKSIDFGPDGKVFVFLNSAAYKKGQIKVYQANGKLLKAYNPYGGFATSGLNATVVSESNDKVYLAVGTQKAGTTVKTYQITAKKFTALNSLTATTKSGNVQVSFQKLYKTQYGLVTMRYGDKKTLKVWKLDLAKNKFVEDKRINKTKLKI